MIRAYDRVYLDKARTALGRMLDFAVYDLKYDIAEFFHLFIKSGVAERFETGDFAVIVGMSGVELAYEVLEQSGVERERMKPNYTVNRSEEFWVGWALAYYQWET
ncbi:MAG: XRE family transcriptional regulator, partial [Clostridia bacterium]